MEIITEDPKLKKINPEQKKSQNLNETGQNKLPGDLMSKNVL